MVTTPEELLFQQIILPRIMDEIVCVYPLQEDDKGNLILRADVISSAKKYRADLSKHLVPGRSIEDTYEMGIAAEMLKAGYYLIVIEGGWIVKTANGEEHQINEDACTCKDFLYAKGMRKCKHLIMRDALTKHRAETDRMRAAYS